MEITYLGHSSFKLSTKYVKIITDPFDPQMVGFPFPKQEADIVTVSHNHSDHNAVEMIEGSPLVLRIPGEYEKKGVRITGFEWYHDKKKGLERGPNILFRIELEGISMLHCGDLGQKFSEDLIEEIGSLDVLFIPVGGVYTIGPDEAEAIISELEPKIVIPMHYRTEKHNENIFKELFSIDEFLKKRGVSGVEPVHKISLKPEDFFEDDKKIVVMTP